MIDTVADPIGLLHAWQRRVGNRPKRPVFGTGFLGIGPGGPGGALIDPSTQQPNLFIAESLALPFGRHNRFVFVQSRDVLDEPAFCTLAGDEGWPAIASLKRVGTAVQS